MTPSAFVDSATGMVVVAIVFAPLIIAVVAAMAIVLAVVNRRHKERMKMIEQGMMPPPPRKQKGNYYGLMITGAVFLALGLARIGAALASWGFAFQQGSTLRFLGLDHGFIFTLVGLALLACFAIIRAARKNEPADKNGVCPPALPPLPPQP
jgi:preprotein translocase subunit YajC